MNLCVQELFHPQDSLLILATILVCRITGLPVPVRDLLTSKREHIRSHNTSSHWSHSRLTVMSLFSRRLESDTHVQGMRSHSRTALKEGTLTGQHKTTNGVGKQCLSQHLPSATARFRAVAVSLLLRLLSTSAISCPRALRMFHTVLDSHEQNSIQAQKPCTAVHDQPPSSGANPCPSAHCHQQADGR